MTSQDYKSMIESALDKTLKLSESASQKGLAESMRYSLLAGGKRVRPMLVLEFCRISGGNVEKALPVACAVEMLHTYSLIHDDLPCMDDDDLRRGKPTNHVVYGECTAVLAGDALQAEAFSSILHAELPAERRARCAMILADAVGVNGMCCGQYLDMSWEGRALSEKELNEIHKNKTGALIAAACMMGVAAAGGSETQISAAEKFGYELGLAFQIQDDLLDVLSTPEELGKPIGSDADENKNTYIVLLGQAGCENAVRQLTENAKEVLRASFDDTAFLEELADTLSVRKN